MNIAEILKDAPKGTKLYSPLFGEVELQSVSQSVSDDIIEVRIEGAVSTFYKDGRYYRSYFNGECLLFPSKDKRNWEVMKVLRRKGSRVFMLFASCNGKELKVYNR